MISVRFQGKPFNITVIQAYAQTSNAEEDVERFYEDLQDLLELTPKKDVVFIIGDWNAKVGQITRMKAQMKKVQEMFNRDQEETKNRQSAMNNT